MAKTDQLYDVGEWVNDEQRYLEEFAGWWLTGRKYNPDLFPKTMSAGQWDEQYRSWGLVNDA